jgi:Cu-Zn family superoxide dismutase
MKINSHLKAGLAAVVAIAAAGSFAAASPASPDSGGADAAATRVFTLAPSTHANPEGVTADPLTGAFFVGATGDGTIYRGTLGNPSASVFIPGATGKSAIGLKIARGRLFVAGGATGDIVVYDLFTRRQVGTFATGTGGFLNDLAITPSGDVFVTDSFRPTLWHVTAAQVRAGQGTPEAISVAPEIAYVAGVFNLNGIVPLDNNTLITVNSNDGSLFRIDLQRSGRAIQKIAVDPVLGGDGMLLDRGRLVVVQGSPAQLTIVDLDRRATRGTIVAHITDPTLRGPSTVARDRDRLLVVNADFATSTAPFTVSGIAARAGGFDDDTNGNDGNDGNGEAGDQ